MILQALNTYYQRLEKDPYVEIAPFGFSRQKISFCVVLNDDGTLHEITPENDGDAAKPKSKLLIVLGGAKPSGSGLNPCFLWDNTGYMLGFKPNDDKPKRSLQAFEAFRQKHVDLKTVIDDPEFHAVCAFLSNWDPNTAADHATLAETSTGFGVFRIRGQTHYVHERETIRAWWSEQADNSGVSPTVSGQCLLTGQVSPIARIHKPQIANVPGAKSNALLVSFDKPAFQSFGKEQSYNAPVSEAGAFQYSTALNYLLRSENGRCIKIGDAITVFWTESPSPAEELFGFIADPSKVAAEDDAKKDALRTLLKRIASGENVSDLGLGEDDTPFYVLGLSPNAARLSVRFWYVSTLQELLSAIRQHFTDLHIVHSERDTEFPAVWQLLRETARESKDIPPLLSGAVMRAVLTGSAYPQMLFAAVIRRIRADREIGAIRAGILKAILNRNSRLNITPLTKEISMGLDPDRSEPAYQLGRLFAELEKTQEDALPGINDTIKDRYFSAASATPGSVFPIILRTSQHHLKKLSVGTKIFHERAIQEICGRFNNFPSHLNLNGQGLFALGYYHQRQALFTKKIKDPK
ncbi:MAG: type I-C CRISPR-associated protein Cas8c/Csd1 [Fuerstiella sp.]